MPHLNHLKTRGFFESFFLLMQMRADAFLQPRKSLRHRYSSLIKNLSLALLRVGPYYGSGSIQKTMHLLILRGARSENGGPENRHRGSGHPLSPATPPYMQVRIRRFATLSPALGRMFDSLTADEGFTTSSSSVGLHPIQKLIAQLKLVGWCVTAHEVFGASVPIEWTDSTCLLGPLLTSAM